MAKRASYREAVEYIALNDAPGDNHTAEEMQGYISVGVIAAIFGKDQLQVARDVERYREKHGTDSQ